MTQSIDLFTYCALIKFQNARKKNIVAFDAIDYIH